MASFTIPSIYTAVDRTSSVLSTIGRANASLANRIDTVTSRSERLFRRVTPGLSDISKQFLNVASTAAIAGAAISLGKFSIGSIIENEKAVASFRTIVSDLNDTDFSKYETAINQVARKSKVSSIDVAQSFEKIAGLNAKFAETAQGISAVTNATITLSRASRDDLGKSAENLVGIMNQFSLGATQANRVINVLAAGQAVGASSITQTAESFTMFGSVASGANVTLEQSVALIETLGKYSLFGSEAGTQLKGTLTHLQKAGLGYASGQFKINDALEQAKKKLDTLKTAKEKDAYITKTFGLINLGAGRILLNNIDTFKDFTKGVTGTSEAQKAAAINSATLGAKIDKLKASWINMLTGSDKASAGLKKAKSIIDYLINNMDEIVSVGISVIKFFAIWKATILVGRVALGAYNIVLGISSALQATASVAVGGSTIAMAAYESTLWLAEAAQLAFNVAASANPLGLLIIGIAGVSKFLYDLYNNWNTVTTLFTTGMAGIKRSFVGTWLTIEDSFMGMADRITLSWKALQMSLGIISAKEFKTSSDKIEIEQAKRDKAIKNNTLYNAASDKKEGRQIMGAFIGDAKKNERQNFKNTNFAIAEKFINQTESTTPTSDAPTSAKQLINPKEAQANATANQLANNQPAINLIVNNALPGTTVTGGSKGVKSSIVPSTTSTQQ